ncbi:MAG: hypothetical protein AB1673_02535 [Actinomycetota bacterium]
MQLVNRGLSASGRFLVLRVLHSTTALARWPRSALWSPTSGSDILAVEHHRAGLVLPEADVEVVLTLETRDPAHRAEVVTALRTAGYQVDLVGRGT